MISIKIDPSEIVERMSFAECEDLIKSCETQKKLIVSRAEDLTQDVFDLVLQKKSFQAIKKYRENTGLSLVDCKHVIDYCNKKLENKSTIYY